MIRHTPRPVRRVYGLAGCAILSLGFLIRAQAQSSPAPAGSDPMEAALSRPLSIETWPVWREAYLRIFYDDDQNPEKERLFYEQISSVFRAMITASGGTLPPKLADDAIARVALAWTFLRLTGDSLSPAQLEGYFTRAEEECRKGIALGDPRGIASYSLAATFIYRGRLRDRTHTPIGALESRFSEAEKCLSHVEGVSPQANVNLWRGEMAELRGDHRKAAALLGKAVDDHPRSARAAIAYLGNALSAPDASGKMADRTGPFLTRFPKSAQIHAIHAGALYRDERYSEAADALDRARQLDPKITSFLGEEAVQAIGESRDLTPRAISGLRSMKAGQYDTASDAFRQAHYQNPGSSRVARLLSRALANRLAARPSRSSSLVESTVNEIRGLGKRFPRDPEIEAALAAALAAGDRHIEAAEALDRVKAMGAQPDRFFDSASLQAIRQGAQDERTTRFWDYTAIAAIIAAVLWIGIMFLMGAILAVCIPRVPRLNSLTGEARSNREIWLERFYLLVLSLGLLIFYASVPVVAFGLLTVALAIFAVLLAIRVLHLGVLQRGWWAFWNVLRCTLIGPRSDVLGIEAKSEEHPRLFESLRVVADRLKTRPVDTVFLTPSSNISVKQEGSGPFGLLGKRRRVLEIGISTLPLLSRDEFHSILAHEYGHFSRNDTFYSRFIFQVSASLATSLAVMSAAGGFLNYINPFYWFWWLYLRAYTLLANGFSRSREFLADRHAVAAYGKQSFISGLTKVAVDGVLFESTVYANIRHQLVQGKAFTNAFDAFRHFREETSVVESRERLLDDLRQTRPKWLDTHPTFSERLAAISQFPDLPAEEESGLAIELLSEPQAVEARLTELLTGYVHANLAAIRRLDPDVAETED